MPWTFTVSPTEYVLPTTYYEFVDDWCLQRNHCQPTTGQCLDRIDYGDVCGVVDQGNDDGEEDLNVYIALRFVVRNILCRWLNETNDWCNSTVFFDDIVARNLLPSTNSSDVINGLGAVIETDDGIAPPWGYDIFTGAVVSRYYYGDDIYDAGNDEVFVDEDLGVVDYEGDVDTDYNDKVTMNNVALIGRFFKDKLWDGLLINDSRIAWPMEFKMVRFLII